MDLRAELQKTLGDAYTLEHELRGGGMSRVYVAHDKTLGRQVVVKVLPPEMTGSVSTERFRREIQVAAKLHHPHIVPLFTAGEVHGIPFFTMPLVEGESLRVRLSHGELPVSEVVSVMRDIAKALVYAHAHGVVHRDIKPDNVLLSSHAATVTDFGVAKALSESTGGAPALTDLGVALGTPAYMSPEQASADPNTDHRTDIYALGAVAYEMLTGQAPFPGRSPQQLLAAHVNEIPDSVDKLRPAIPAALTGLVTQCLAKRAADRPQTAEEVLHALEAIATPSGGISPTTATMAVSGSRARWIGVAAAVLGVAAIGGYVATRGSSAPGLNPNRVVVAPFTNMTGDTSLNAIGAMTADWVTQGLSQLDSLDVVPSYAVMTGADGNVRQFSGVDALRAIGEETRAGRVIWGSYYRQGDTLRIQGQIVDVDKGTVEVILDPVVGRIGAPDEAVAQMRGRVLSAMESSGLRSRVGSIGTLPSLAAYREFLAGWGPGAVAGLAQLPHYIRASQLDTNFTLAIYYVGLSYINASRLREADSVVQVLKARRDRLSPAEQDLLAHLDASARRDHNASRLAILRMLARDSAVRSFTNAAYSAINTNRPRECLDILRALPPTRVPDFWINYWLRQAQCAHMLGDYRAELTAALTSRQYLANKDALTERRAYALIGLADLAGLRALSDSILGVVNPASVDVGFVHEATALELFAHGHPAEADRHVKLGLEWLAGRLPADTRAGLVFTLGRLLILDGQLDSARSVFSRSAAADTGFTGPRIQLAVIAALTGDTATANSTIRVLDSLAARPYSTGLERARQARIAAALGRKDDAVRYLEIGIQEGLAFDVGWHADFEFRTLLDYEPFRTLLRPKGE